MHIVSISKIYFDYINTKKKRIEGRLNTGKYSTFKKGDEIKFICGGDFIDTKIKKIRRYKSFEEYLSMEGLHRTLPNTKTINDGVNIYRQFYSEENEKRFGILAIHIKKI